MQAVEWVLSNHMEATVIGDLYINSAGHLALRKAKDRTFLVSVLPDTVLVRTSCDPPPLPGSRVFLAE